MIRVARPDDYGYIVKSWVRSYSQSPFALAVGPAHEAKLFEHDDGSCVWSAGQTYHNGHHDLVNRLVRDCVTLVYEADDGLIDAFACGQPSLSLLHYVFVREHQRKQGYGKALVKRMFAESPVTFTHQTREIKVDRLPRTWTFSAYPLMREGAPKPVEGVVW